MANDTASMTAVLQAQRDAFAANLSVSAAVRKQRLQAVITLLRENADAFCQAMSEDFGHRSIDQSMFADISASIKQARHALKHLDAWMRPERRPLDFPLGLLGASARVEYQPKGVVGIIAPWNFPVQLTMGPLVGVLAAGNRAMIKSSEFTPATSAFLEELMPKYFAVDEVCCFSGGPDVGAAFAGLPFDHLIFTGANGIGRHILHAAADNLTPVTLELGGKSPAIISASADIPQAAERLALGKLMNAGQICLAPDYVLIQPERETAFVDALAEATARLYPTMVNNPDYTSVINARHRDRLNGLIDDARAKGASVRVINPANEDFAASNGNKMPLTVLQNVDDTMAVMQQEIFGPILPVMRISDTESAIQYVNGHDRPLGLYYFGSDSREEARVLEQTISGGVTINDVIFHISAEDLPFGGIGPSGMGAYHGLDGFRTFSHAKAIYRQSRLNIAKIAGIAPPYGKALQKTIAREMR